MRNVLLAGLAAIGLLTWQAGAVSAATPDEHQSGATEGQKAKPSKAQGVKTVGAAGDQAFVLEAASGGMMEVELGRMAANEASSDEVKKFGQKMVDDHSKANNDLSALAQKKGITLRSEMNQKTKAIHDRLAKLNGAAFDKAYMQHMVADHTKDVRAFQREAKMGKDADIKAWAGQVLPTLEDHLKQAKQIASAVGGPSKEGKSGKGEHGRGK